jgi:hypothetical protein
VVFLLASGIAGCGAEPGGSDSGPLPPPGTEPSDGGVEPGAPTTAAATGRVVFESSSVNFAWGFQLRGRYIDEDGAIWEFARDDTTPWMPRTTIDGRLLASSLDLKLQDANYVGKVDAAELARMAALIEPASNAELVQENIGADMGADSLVGYLYDAESDTYTSVTLRSRGDWNIDNPSHEAGVLIEWLDMVLQTSS